MPARGLPLMPMTQPPSDDERTVIRPASPPAAGRPDFVASSSLFGHTLPEGTRLGEFEITGLIGEGGFGIVYLAWDPSLERRVAVKEYMPSSLASRANHSVTVAPRSERHVETFRAGLKSFVNEARLLAKFDHPALVKVYRFWEANGTAYMVMPYYQGPTLKKALADMRQPPSEQALRHWLGPLLDALEVMHTAQCYHRDIAPDNILLTDTGPLLLDFGAARRVVSDMTHALTVVLKPGYAPIEQYGDAPTMSQGAWTDLYALACVMHYAIGGRTPPSSIERLMGDRLKPASEIGAGRYSAGFLRAIDAALRVQPSERPQSVAEFRALLDAGSGIDVPITTSPLAALAPTAQHDAPDLVLPTRAPAAEPPAAPATAPVSRPAPFDAGPPPRPQPAGSAASTPAAPTWMPLSADTPETAAAPQEPTTRRRLPVAVALGAGALVLASALAVVAWRGAGPSAPSADATPAVPAAANPAASAAVPAIRPAPVEPAAAPAPTEVTRPAAAPTPAPAPATTAAPSAEPAPTPPVAATPTATTSPRARADAPPRATPVATRAERSPPARAAKPARCTEILQKASLEPLQADELRFLKRECQ
jgi:serine/threonine protein kinase